MSNSDQRRTNSTAKATGFYPLEFLNYPITTKHQVHPMSESLDMETAYRKAQAAQQSGQFCEPIFRAIAVSFYVNQARQQAARAPLCDQHDRFRAALSALAPSGVSAIGSHP